MPVCWRCGEGNPEHARFCLDCGAGLSTPAESRRPVTVLFCDLVGSTSLGASLDAESVRTILGRYFDAMRAAIERHGGRVEKFIGDAVMAAFGVPRLHEDDALRAVRAASEMREALSLLNKELERDWALTLDVRIGISSGEVVTGDPLSGTSMVTGSPVNLAARLEQVANPGEILFAESTLRLVRHAVVSESAGPFSLKGFGEAVTAHRLLGVTPFTEPHAGRLEPAMVDREREMSLLWRTFERAASSRRCQLLTVLGPPGIGKSRLVEEFQEASRPRANQLRGRCLSYGEGITFWPVREAVRQAAGLTDADPTGTAVQRIVDVLPEVEDADLVTERLGQALGLVGGTPAPEEILWAIRRFFEAQARERPLVLVFEDIHWAEPTFLELIEHMADRSTDAPIMLLCLARPDLLEAHPTWAGGRANAAVLLLEPLALHDTETLVGNILGPTELPSDIRSRIIEQAEGYPLYAEEIVSVLIDEGRLVLEGDRWVAVDDLSQLSIPSTISGLLAARLDRLEPGERAAIERAAVIGRDFSASEIAAISPPEQRPHLDEHLGTLVRKELVRPAGSPTDGDGAYRFRHMLILDAAYDAMKKTARAELHERYAGWLEARAEHQIEKYEEVVAYHLERAHRLRTEVGPAGKEVDELALRAALRLAPAGRLAFTRGDMPAAANLLGRAVRLLPRGTSDRNELLHDLGLALWQAGEIDEVDGVYREELEVGKETGDQVLEARSRLALAELTMEIDPTGIAPDRLREEAERSIAVFDAIGDHEDLADALLVLGTTHWLAGNITEMLDVSSRALTLARSAASATGATNYVGRALVLGTAHCDDAISRMETTVDDFVDHRMLEATAGLDLATIYAMVDRPDEAAARAARSLSVFEELGQGRWVAEGNHTRGLVSWLGGDAAAAEAAIRAAYDWFERRGEVLELASSSIDLAHVLLDLDRVEEAHAMADASSSSAAPYDLEAQIGWRTAEGKVLARRGSHAEARTLVREALDLVSGTQFLNLRGAVLTDMAEVCARGGRTAEAADAAREGLVSYERKGNRVGYRRTEALLRKL